MKNARVKNKYSGLSFNPATTKGCPALGVINNKTQVFVFDGVMNYF